jgi:hypothetical protein
MTAVLTLRRELSVLTGDGALACALMAALLVGACSAGGQVKPGQGSELAVARLMAINDNFIVPGERVGSVFLGMTEEQLYTKMGSPAKNFPPNRDGDVLYSYMDLSVYVKMATHRVKMIQVTGPAYRTAQGVSIGSSELELKAKVGQPAWEILSVDCSKWCPPGSGSEVKLCYNAGLTAYANGGYVLRLEIWPGRCGS